jgi:hypothetical protein
LRSNVRDEGAVIPERDDYGRLDLLLLHLNAPPIQT